MEQLRWFWLAIFLLSLGWLGYNYGVFVNTKDVLAVSQPEAVPQATTAEAQTVDPQAEIPDTQEAEPLPTASSDNKAEDHIKVETDTYLLWIDPQGGVIQRAALKKYPLSVARKDIPTEILQPRSFLVQSGLVAADRNAAPSHKALYRADKQTFTMKPGQPLDVSMRWKNDDGIEVRKVFTFTPGSYRIDVQHIVDNGSEQQWAATPYVQIMRLRPTGSGNHFVYTYTGPALFTPENRYQKLDFDDIDDGDSHESLNTPVKNSWIAMLQHYFLAAVVPPAANSVKIFVKKIADRYYIGYTDERITVDPGARATASSQLFVGPTDQKRLISVHPDLDYAVDYGVFHVIAAPLFWALNHIHTFSGNWGVAIILLTLIIKLLFYKLSEKSYRSMAKLRKLTPRIQQLKERYGDDKQAMNRKMMAIYKEEKVNPLGGCLPVLVQIPVFISLYWVLIESVELRQAPFFLWINDLSAADPYFVLPVLMGISMWFQQRLSPMPPDPIQAKVMQLLPIIFTIFFLFFPSGLVLYWVTNNILSIAQQWWITKKLA